MICYLRPKKELRKSAMINNLTFLLPVKRLFALAMMVACAFAQTALAQCQPLGPLTLTVVNLNPAIQGTDVICPGSSTVLSVDGTYDLYAWSTGATDPTITVSSPDVYTVTVTTSSGCTATAQLGVTVFSEPIPTINTSPYNCDGIFVLDAGAGFVSYDWSNGDSDQNAIANASGTYTVTVTNSDGCTGTDEIAITIPAEPQVVITGEDEFCIGNSTILQATPGFSSYTWTGGLSQDNIEVFSGGLYEVTVSDNLGCTATAIIDVDELPFSPPTIIGDLTVCANNSTVLTAQGQNYTSYQWSNGQSTESIVVNIPGTYTVTVVSINGCSGATSATVQNGGNASTSITGNTVICQGASTTLSATGNFSSYSWSNGLSSPSVTLNQAGTYIVTVTDAAGCTGSASANVTNFPDLMVTISPITGNICEGDAPFNLTATPPNGIWGGDVGASGQVDPAALGAGNWTATYSVTDANGCTGTDELDFEILTGTNAAIAAAGPFCGNEPLQTLTATPTGGTWGGAANSNGQIDPSMLGPGTYTVTYTVASTGACTGYDETNILVTQAPSASIAGTGTVCEGSGQTVPIDLTTTGNGPFELIYTLNGTNPDTISLSLGASSIDVAAPGNYAILNITDVNGCMGTGTGQATVNSVGSPQVIDFELQCNPTNDFYTVVFELTGGDAGSYEVLSSINGNLTGPPFLFTSDPIPSNSPYQFTVNDVNNCNPTVLQGSHNCLCATDAGNMSATPISFCSNEAAVVAASSSPHLDNDDALVYVLHDGNSNSLGTVFSTSQTPSFNLFPPLVIGTTYYVSAVAGNGMGNGGVDFADPCLSVAIGTPIIWTELPSANLIGGGTICLGETVDLNFNLVGNGPFDVSYSDGTQVIDLDNIADGHSISVTPLVATTYTIISVTETNGAACSSNVGTSTTINVVAPSNTFLQATSCDPNAVGVFTQNFTNQNGCDSTVTTTVTFVLADTTALFDTSCDPSQVGVFTQTFTSQNGCDSTTVLTVTYQAFDETNLTGTTCDPAQAGVFIQNFVNQFGCDSIVTTTVTLLPSDVTQLSATTCDPAQTGIFTQNFINQFGCDSIVTTTVTLLPSDVTQQSATTCDPTQAGIFTQNFVNQFGCDSIVTTTVSLLPSDVTQLSATTCDPTQVGIFTQTFSGQNGCDSVVVTTVSLSPPSACGVLFQLAAETIPCGSTAGSFEIALTLGQLPLSFEYIGSTGAVGNGIMVTSPFEIAQLPAGNYTVTLTNSSGITSTASVEVKQATPPSLDISILDSLDCSDDPIGSLKALVTGDFPPYNLLWSNGETTSTIADLPAGQYQVTATGGFGCETVASIELQAVPLLQIGLTVNAPDCFDENGGFVEVAATGGQAPYQYSLNGGNFVADGLFTGLTGGTYQIEAMDANGCKSSEGFAINLPLDVVVSLGDDMTIELGDGATITAVVNLPDSLLANINWTGFGNDMECPSCLSQLVAPVATTTYTITVESTAGCIGADALTVFVNKKRAVFVPNSFSPNDDGINDVFYPFAKNSAVEKVNSFYVFSRWGELVYSAIDFQPNDPTHGWDGSHRDQVLDAAVFVWYAEIKFKDGEVVLFEGDVSLMR